MTVAVILIVATLIGSQVSGYPPPERLMPDGAPVPASAVKHEDSVASASELAEEYEDTDDSDMYMEPEAESSEDLSSQEVTPELPQQSTTPQNNSKDQQTETTKEISQESPNPEDKSLETDSQNFFPSFAELFSNHRLPFTEQQRYRSNRFLSYFQRDRSGYQPSAATTKDVHHPILGSGNFGVIRGGTYYPEDKDADEYSSDDSIYSPYYHSAGRSRMNYFRNPKPQPVRGGDFFANFRDFADITAPPKSSFSHLSVVYANKNDSSTGRITGPRNIIETLRMLEQKESSLGDDSVATEVPRKKESKGKRKLMKMKQYEEDKARRTRVTVEPLLALS